MNKGMERDEFYSQEAQQIIGKEPAWVVRYGVYVVLCLLLLLFAGSFLIRYSDVVSGKIKLELQPSSYRVQAGCGGRLEWLRHDGNSVHRGELIGVVKNDANTNDIYQLKSFLFHAGNRNISSADLPKNLHLGELQTSFEALKHTLALRFSHDPTEGEKEKLYDQLHAFHEQLSIKKRELNQWSPDVYEWNFLKKNEVFWQDADDRYRLAWQRVVRSEEELSNTVSEMEERLSTPRLAAQNLLRKISAWEKKYALVAPADGRLILLQPEVTNEMVTKGQPLFRIDGSNGVYTALAQVPAKELSRLQTGQESHIRLNRHSTATPIFLHAVVDSFGVQEDGDTAFVRFRIKDKIGTEKEVKTGVLVMTGRVEVILEKRSLFERLFKNINMFF